MDCQSTSRDRKSFDEPSEGVKKANSLSRLPCSGNRQALDDLFASSSSHLYQAAFRILSNPHDAEDAVQDSLLCAFRNLNQFRGHARFSTWLHRIAINSSLMRLRKRKCGREFPLEPVFTGKELVAPGIDPLSLFNPDALFFWIRIIGKRVDSWCNQFLACKHWLERKLASALSLA